jgi:hypothetical protein
VNNTSGVRFEPAGSGTSPVPPSVAASVATGADALAVLDDGGAELAFRGAIGTSAQHALFGGRSALLGVPAEARWLSLRTGGNEVARVRLVLQPGAHAVLVR